jgi:type IV secretory pathway VirB3-like protein
MFDMIQGMSCDYMHSVLLGVSCILLCLWIDSKFHQEIWYLGAVVKQLDNRLCKIRPPGEIRRTPRSIENNFKFWKGAAYSPHLGQRYL